MLLYIVRHGQTEHNIQGIIQGQLDTPLNDWGREESRRLAEYLSTRVKFDEAYTSPLSRAHETASIIMARQRTRIRLKSKPALMERSLGSLEGNRRKRGAPLPDDVESSKEVFERIENWLEELIEAHNPSEDSTNPPTVETIDTPKILIVSHSAWISYFVSAVLSKPYQFQVLRGVNLKAHMINTCVMTVRIWQTDRGKWQGVITSYGETQHLRGLNEPVIDSADLVK